MPDYQPVESGASAPENRPQASAEPGPPETPATPAAPEPARPDAPEPARPAAPPPPLPPLPSPGFGYAPPPPPPPKRRAGCFMRVLLGIAVLVIMLVVVAAMLKSLLGGGTRGFGSKFAMSGDRLGLVRIEGEIGPTDYKDFWMESLRSLGEDSRVKGIVVRIDSPGGTVGASQELYALILRIRREQGKPVYVSMGDMAASGGYYIASAADRIYANSGSLTGSIGVIFKKPTLGELARKVGVDMDVVKSGRMKNAGDLLTPLGPEERAMFDLVINDTYEQFMIDVLAGRAPVIAQACQRLKPEVWTAYGFQPVTTFEAADYLRQIADGRVYTGRQALELGLVDQLGPMDQCLRDLADRLHIDGRPAVLEPTRRLSLLESLGVKAGALLPGAESPLQMRMPGSF